MFFGGSPSSDRKLSPKDSTNRKLSESDKTRPDSPDSGIRTFKEIFFTYFVIGLTK